jgi:hypothetical protein
VAAGRTHDGSGGGRPGTQPLNQKPPKPGQGGNAVDKRSGTEDWAALDGASIRAKNGSQVLTRGTHIRAQALPLHATRLRGLQLGVRRCGWAATLPYLARALEAVREACRATRDSPALISRLPMTLAITWPSPLCLQRLQAPSSPMHACKLTAEAHQLSAGGLTDQIAVRRVLVFRSPDKAVLVSRTCSFVDTQVAIILHDQEELAATSKSLCTPQVVPLLAWRAVVRTEIAIGL